MEWKKNIKICLFVSKRSIWTFNGQFVLYRIKYFSGFLFAFFFHIIANNTQFYNWIFIWASCNPNRTFRCIQCLFHFVCIIRAAWTWIEHRVPNEFARLQHILYIEIVPNEINSSKKEQPTTNDERKTISRIQHETIIFILKMVFI